MKKKKLSPEGENDELIYSHVMRRLLRQVWVTSPALLENVGRNTF